MMIVSPVAVIKELVENAFDAGATFIQVESDSTTIGHIQVRDNGPGIAPGSDRALLAVPNTTSKISTFEDIFGETEQLGFRGEALSCIADLAESSSTIKMRVTTRTEKEVMAQTWLVNRDGTAVMPYDTN